MSGMRIGALFLLLIAGLLLGASPVWAHDAIIQDEFDLALGESVVTRHDDLDPYKGTLTLTVSNTGTSLWGSFHFEIDDPTNGDVIFTDDEFTPFMTYADESPYSDYYYDISIDGLELDFIFNTNPVESGESVTFSFYTDNTAEEYTWFDISLNPNPVPVPAAAWLMCSGLIAGAGIYRRKN